MIRVVFEDADLLVVEKPAGIPTQPQTSPNPLLREEGVKTLAELLSGQYPEIRNVGGNDWGAVHRLDVETSGLVVFARHQRSYDFLRKEFSTHRVEKEYTALVEGILREPGKIIWPIGPDPKTQKRVKVYKGIKEAVKNKAQEAVTIYAPLTRPSATLSPGSERGRNTLLKIKIKTGRRHQIRAHLAALGHPIVGDRLYGKSVSSSPTPPLQLHATRLKFKHPQGNRWVEVAATPSFSSCASFP